MGAYMILPMFRVQNFSADGCPGNWFDRTVHAGGPVYAAHIVVSNVWGEGNSDVDDLAFEVRVRKEPDGPWEVYAIRGDITEVTWSVLKT